MIPPREVNVRRAIGRGRESGNARVEGLPRQRSPRCGKIAEGEMGLQARNWFAIELGVRVDEIVQGIALLLGREANITARGEEHAIVVMSPEQIVALGGVLGGFGGVDGNPTGTLKIKLRPTVIAGDIPFRVGFGKREADFIMPIKRE
jgi:hypothetical protein